MDGGVGVNLYNGQYNSFDGNYSMQPAYSNNNNTYGQIAVKFENDSYHSGDPINVAETYPYGGNGYYQTSLQQALNQEFGTNHVTPVQKIEPSYGMSFQTGGELEVDSDTTQNKKAVTNGTTCDICNKQFSSQPSLKRHKETHLGHKRFSCELCGNCYTQKHNLTKHMRLHTGEKPYKCTICDKAFYIHHHLKNHMVQHTGEYPYSCSICGRGFKTKSKMENHIATHEKNAVEGIPLQSPSSVGINSEENSMSETWENMSENMMDESEDYTEEMLDDSFEEEIRSEEHKCEICQQIFISTESLNNHVKLTHTSVEEFKCDECDSIFLSEAHLIQHRKVHISKGNYKCEDCGASFRFKVSLHIHMRRHNNDYKKHECSLCNKYFLSKESLKKHMSDHLKMTVYQCDECGEEFDQKAEFTSHMLTHSDKDSSPNAKPVCKTCFKSFSSNSSLRKHEFIHLDVKPHRCEICNVSFAQKVQLKLHNKRHNDGLLEPSTPPHLPEPSAPVQELAPASAPAPSPKKATKQTKKDPKDSPTKFQKPEVVPERRNAPRKARNALREQREEENGDKQSAKDTRRRNTPRKARNVIKEEEEEEEEEDSEEDSSDSDDSSSDSDSSDDESDAYSSEDKQQDKNHEEHDEEGAKPLDKLEGYRYPVCEKCNQTFRKRSSLRRHQKSCR